MNVHQPLYRHASYRDGAVRPESIAMTVDETAEFLLREGVEFDSIACCGISGLLIAPMLAWRLGKELIIVHKAKDGSHSPYEVEGNVGTERYIIVDDLIDTGDTIRHIVKSVQEKRVTYGFNPTPDPKCVGIYLYAARRAGRKPSKFWQNPAGLTCSSGYEEEDE